MKDNQSINSIFFSEDKISDLSDFFKIMGDNTRLKILIVLIHNKYCVNEIADIIGLSQSAVSHQLKVLRKSKLVKTTRKGRYIYYSLDDEHVDTILNMAIEHINEN